MLNKKTVDDLKDIAGKKVLVRCDFNVPLKQGVIQNYKRIDAALPTIKKLLEQKAKVILCSHMGNVLEEVTIPMHPIISDIKQNMMNHGAVGAMMSGSGPTVFGFFEDNKTARAAKEALTKSGMVKQLYLTTLFNNK